MASEAWEKAKKLRASREIARKFAKYQKDPSGFGEKELGDHYTSGIVEVMNSVRDNPVTIAKSCVDYGKCVTMDSRIPLHDGSVVAAAELVGKSFMVVTYDNGEQYPQFARAEYNGEKPCYRVTTKSGRTVDRTHNHPLMIGDRFGTRGREKVNNLGWVKVEDIKPGQCVALPMKIMANAADDRPEDEVKLLGYLLGDGGITQGVRFTNADPRVKNEFREIVERLGGRIHINNRLTDTAMGRGNCATGLPGSNPIINMVRDWGIYNKKSTEKSFPDWVWRMPNERLALLLNRLFACDGYIVNRDDVSYVGITLASERMIRDVELAMLRLGINGRVRHRIVAGKFHAWEWTAHRAVEFVKFCQLVGIYGKEDRVEIGLERALRRVNVRQKKWHYQSLPVGYMWDEIKSVEYLGEVPTVIISVDHTHTFVTTFVEHNSHGAARVAIWFYKCFPDSQVYITAAPPLDNLRRILWGEVSSVVQKNPAMFEEDRIRALSISRNPLSFIAAVAIPTSGTAEERESKFCADADELFEMMDGSLVRYKDLIGRIDVPVVSVDGKFRRSLSHAEFFDNGKQPVYEILFEDGEIVRRTGNHPLYSSWDIRPDSHKYPNLNHKHGQIRPHEEGWREVASLSSGCSVLCPEDTAFNSGTNCMDEDKLKFLGYMIGDGCFLGKNSHSNRLQFTQENNQQLKEFLSILDNLGARYSVSDRKEYNWVSVSTSDKELASFARECGLMGKGSADKFVPQQVFRLPNNQVALFLSRLFATDGWACLTNKAEIGYSSKSHRLVLDIQILLRRFGILGRIKPKIVNGETYWTLSINLASDIIRFAANVGIYGKENGVQKCLHYASGRKWVHATWKFEKPGYRWKKVVSVKEIGQRPTVGVHVPGDNTYLTSLVEHNSGKHSANLLFIVDEGDAVPDEVYRGIEGCMSGGNARLLVMFNPRSATGPVYMKERDHLANVVHLSAFDHPNVITGNNLIPGAVTRETTMRRMNQWTRPLAIGEPYGEDCFEVPPYLVGQVVVGMDGKPYPPIPADARRIIDPAFSYMVLGEYPAQAEAQLISRQWIDAARNRWDLYASEFREQPPVGIKPIMGLDMAEYGVDSNSACFRYGGYVARFRTWSDMDVDKSVTVALKLYQEYGADMCMVDGTGLGAAVAPGMARRGRDMDVRAVSVKASERPSPHIRTELGEFTMLRDQLWWALREWLRTDPTAMLPPDAGLLEELLVPTYSVRENGKVKVMSKDSMRDRLKRSPDRADALCLTFAPFARAKVSRLGG